MEWILYDIVMSCHVMLSYGHVDMRYETCFGYSTAQMTLAWHPGCFVKSLRPKLEARCGVSDFVDSSVGGRLVGI